MIPNPITHKLCQWLDATTSYSNEPKENLIRKPNYEPTPKWRLFYQYGPMLVMDESGVLDAEGKPTAYKLAVKHISYNQSVQPGEIITSANGRQYVVQPNGSVRKI